jgi:hypothetical protein
VVSVSGPAGSGLRSSTSRSSKTRSSERDARLQHVGHAASWVSGWVNWREVLDERLMSPMLICPAE